LLDLPLLLTRLIPANPPVPALIVANY
jgi:hypothetical protein